MTFDPFIPGALLEDLEADEAILQLGALASIIQNKRINPAKLIVAIVNDQEFAAVAQHILSTDNVQETVKLIATRFPSVATSKIVITRKKSNARTKASRSL